MNIAKKSTSKNVKINGNSENKNANAILILEDDAHNVTKESDMKTNHSLDNADDVIICNVELPNHAASNISNVHPENNVSESLNGPTKRTSEFTDHSISKKLKTSMSPPITTLCTPVNKMILLTPENLNNLIKEALKDELVAYQRDAFNQYNNEIHDLKIALEHWRQTAQKLHNEILELKNKERLSDTSAISQTKDLPCNLPPASANPVTSQHLKIIHSSTLGINQSTRNAIQLTPQIVGRVPASSFQSSPLIIQPKITPSSKQSGVIDLTSEDDSSKAKIEAQLNQIVNPSTGELGPTDSNKDAVGQEIDSYANLKIPPPPLPPPNQPAPPHAKDLPPKPIVNLTNDDDGVHLTWDCVVNPSCEEAVSYHLFSYQSVKEAPNKFLWKRVGNMVAMPLPMVCSLVKSKLDRQAAFAIRGVDRHCRLGLFSDVVVLNREIIT